MAPAVQRVDGDHADARAVGAVFTHQAVRVGPVWEVFGHEGNGDGDLRQVLGGTLDLGESRGQRGGSLACSRRLYTLNDLRPQTTDWLTAQCVQSGFIYHFYMGESLTCCP